MGVQSFWDIVGPTARPVRLESLQDKKMAIDASIWIYQFLKAMRDSNGNSIKNSHITGFFRRICKLLYFGIKPVFVFDGGVPPLKRETIKARNERRQGKRDSAARTARKLLALQMHHNNSSQSKKQLTLEPSDKVFKPHDDWDLPDIEGFYYKKDDQRINPEYNNEKQKILIENSAIDDAIDDLDLDSINPASEEFAELPKAVQYQILSNLRLRSRLRMGYMKDQLKAAFPNSLDFSKFQIDMVKRRNFYTQKLINVTGLHDGGASKLEDEELVQRIAGKQNREYKLAKTENGWTLGLTNQDGTSKQQPILIDIDQSESSEKKDSRINHDSDEDDEFDWEDVDLKPKEKKRDNFDYSLKAGRLPELEIKDQKVGSQSFLDTRPSEESPLKKARQFKQLSVVQNHRIDDDDTIEDDYLKQIEEIELMEAVQRSKLEERLKEAEINSVSEEEELFKEEKLEKDLNNLKKDRVTHNKMNIESDEHSTKLNAESKKENPKENASKGIRLEKLAANATPTTLNKTAFTETKNVKRNTSLASESDLPSNQQQLDFIVNKISEPQLNMAQSFLFGDNSQNNSVISEVTEASGKKVIPEIPTWFNPISQKPSHNPYSSTNFVNDKETADDTRSKATYKLLSGFDAQEYLDRNERHEENAPEGEGDLIEIIAQKEMGENTHNLEGGETINHISEEINNKGISTLKKDMTVESNSNAMSKKLHRHDTENRISENKARDSNIPMVFDYEFSEGDEDGLIEEMQQEEKNFEQFKHNELHMPHQNDIVDTTFLEDELFEKQMKDKRDSDEVTPDMITDVQELLSRFGIPFITAPMEAEAQCAELLHLKLVDGIITDDSDVFLFGGTKVYKNLFHDKKYVEYYNEDSILANLGIDRNIMIQLALLLGSDYTTGIRGMGPVSSMEVLAEFGDLEAFKRWYNEGQFDKRKQEKEGKYEKELRKKLVNNEVILDSSFPNELVFDAYMRPEVDHDTTPFNWGVPDLDMLRDFLYRSLGWQQEKSDEVLIPLIRDINQKKKEKKQMKLTEFFPKEFISENRKIKLGKRIITATGKLKKRRLK